jgi:hypothetical protein
MEDKIKLVENFNIDNYFEYQSRFYDELPEWVTKEQSEIEKKALEEWEKYRDSIKMGQPSTKHEGQELELSEKAKQAIQEHTERQNKIEILHNLEMPILSYYEFQGLKEIIYNGIKTDIKEKKAVLDLKIMDKETIFKNEKDKSLELVNIGILKYLQQPMPLSKIHLLEVISTFCAVGVIQWIMAQIGDEQKQDEPIEENKKHKSARQIEWKQSKQALYYLFRELINKQFIQGTKNDIAQLICSGFIGFNSVADVRREISSDKNYLKPRASENIDDIFKGIDNQ